MSSFFTAPGAQKKRKRSAATAPEAPKKKVVTSAKGSGRRSNTGSASKPQPKPKPKPNSKSDAEPRRGGAGKKAAAQRDESISGSDSEEYDSEDDDGARDARRGGRSDDDSSSDEEKGGGETAAERRLRLAERYLDNVRQEADELAFDAEEIDRDIIAERLQEDVAEAKGKVYRRVAGELDLERATHTVFRWNSENVTSVALCAPHAYTTSKDGLLVKWKLQEPQQAATTTTTTRKKKQKKPPAPPRRRPEKIAFTRGDSRRARDKTYQGHTGAILAVAASQDGRFVVTGGADRRLVVHDATTLQPLRVFAQHRGAVTGLAFRRGTNQLFSSSRDRTVKVWSLDELAYVETLFGHQDDVVDIDALAQERCVSVGARDRTARLWKVVDETQLVFRGGGVPNADKKPKVLPSSLPPDAADDVPLHPSSLAHEGSMDRVAMVDDDLFVTGSDNGALALWSLQKKKPLFVLPRAHGIDPPLRPDQVSAETHPDPTVVPPPQPRWITALRTLPYSDLILTGSWDGCVRMWRLSDDKRKIEAAGVVGAPSAGAAAVNGVNGINGIKKPAKDSSEGGLVRGIVNDISLSERGDRGKDGLCVVVAVGKEHRLGRWKVVKGARNGAVVFEIPRMARRANGIHAAVDGDVSS